MKRIAYALSLFFLILAYIILNIDWAPGLLAFPIIAILTFVATLIHELGHAIVAHSLGARIEQVVVLPFSWRRGVPGLKLTGSIEGGEIGGYVACAFDADITSGKRVWIALAGPVANIALFVTALAVVTAAGSNTARPALRPTIASNPTPVVQDLPRLPSEFEQKRWIKERQRAWNDERTRTVVRAILAALAILSLGMGLSNLIPFPGSDGHAIWRALKLGYV